MGAVSLAVFIFFFFKKFYPIRLFWDAFSVKFPGSFWCVQIRNVVEPEGVKPKDFPRARVISQFPKHPGVTMEIFMAMAGQHLAFELFFNSGLYFGLASQQPDKLPDRIHEVVP